MLAFFVLLIVLLMLTNINSALVAFTLWKNYRVDMAYYDHLDGMKDNRSNT